MNGIQIFVVGFGVLSAGIWLMALVINALVFLQRVVFKVSTPLDTVGVVAVIAGVWTFFAARSMWPHLSMGWLVVALAPQVLAIAANAFDYRKPDAKLAPDSDNPKA